MSAATDNRPRRGRGGRGVTLVLGAALIGGCGLLMAVDVSRRGGLVVPTDRTLPPPDGALGGAARFVAANMTVLCWIGALLLFDGLLHRLTAAGSPVRARPNRFIAVALTGVSVWCFFDVLNFQSLGAWTYHGLPDGRATRMLGYLVAFATISPAMFLSAELIRRLGAAALRLPAAAGTWVMAAGLPAAVALLTLWILIAGGGETARTKMILGSALLLLGPATGALIRSRTPAATAFAFGFGFVLWAMLIGNAVACMTLWLGLIYLLDPINAQLGAPSLLRDWQAGRFGRTAALFAGGAFCGLLWELWNYWALVKWTYDLPFMGAWEQYRYFEMPWAGFPGFLPFACECWVVFNTIVVVLNLLRLRVVEPLPDEAII